MMLVVHLQFQMLMAAVDSYLLLMIVLESPGWLFLPKDKSKVIKVVSLSSLEQIMPRIILIPP